MQAVRYVMGWSEVCPPQTNAVIVFAHTSVWDSILLLLYCDINWYAKLYCLAKPQLFENPLIAQVLKYIGLMPAGKRENHSSGTTKTIVQCLKRQSWFDSRLTYFLISPKGTVSEAPWRSGYRYIAKDLGWPVVAVRFDYINRSIIVSEPINPEDPMVEERLQLFLSTGCPLVPHNSEFKLDLKDYDSCELCCPVDLLVLSNLCAIPNLYVLWTLKQYELCIIGLLTFAASLSYHRSKERLYKDLDSVLAKLLLVSVLSQYWYNIFLRPSVLVLGMISYVLYSLGCPRDASKPRGTYIFVHSTFHVAVSFCVYQLIR